MNNSTLPQGRDIGRTSDTPAGWAGYPIQSPATPAPPPDPRRAVEPVTANEKALVAIKSKIGSTPHPVLFLHNSYLGLKHLRDELTKTIAVDILRHARNAESHLGHLSTAGKFQYDWARGQGEELLELAKISAGLSVLEADPKLPEALELLGGLHDERERLEAAVKTEREEKAQAHQAVIDAEKAAVEKAHAAAASDPDLQAARQRLASFDVPAAAPDKPLVRGRQKLASDREPLEIEKLFSPE